MTTGGSEKSRTAIDDAHRPLREVDNLERILTWQEERTMSSQLVVHYKRGKYIIEPNDAGMRAQGQRVRIFESEDGRLDIRHGDASLIFRKFEQRVEPAAIVDNKCLGAALAYALEFQKARDAERLAEKKLPKRYKNRIRRTSNTDSGNARRRLH